MKKEEFNLANIIDNNLNIREPDKSYDRDDVYALFDLYSREIIDESTFEDEFYLKYTRDGTINLSQKEIQILDELGSIIHRYSEFQEDHIAAPLVFVSKEQARDAIINAKGKLENIQHLKI